MKGPDLIIGAAVVGSMPLPEPREHKHALERHKVRLDLFAVLRQERLQGAEWLKDPRTACAVEYAAHILTLRHEGDPEDIANLRRLEVLSGAPIAVIRVAFSTALVQLDAETSP